MGIILTLSEKVGPTIDQEKSYQEKNNSLGLFICSPSSTSTGHWAPFREVVCGGLMQGGGLRLPLQDSGSWRFIEGRWCLLYLHASPG